MYVKIFACVDYIECVWALGPRAFPHSQNFLFFQFFLFLYFFFFSLSDLVSSNNNTVYACFVLFYFIYIICCLPLCLHYSSTFLSPFFLFFFFFLSTLSLYIVCSYHRVVGGRMDGVFSLVFLSICLIFSLHVFLSPLLFSLSSFISTFYFLYNSCLGFLAHCCLVHVHIILYFCLPSLNSVRFTMRLMFGRLPTNYTYLIVYGKFVDSRQRRAKILALLFLI